VVDGVGVAIDTPKAWLVHTGDFKLSRTADGSGTDVQKFSRCGERGVLALLSDSTNIEREGATVPDSRIAETFTQIVEKSPGRIIVALFASNIGRIQTIVDIARQAGRKVIISGRSIEASAEIAKTLGYLTVPRETDVSIDLLPDYPGEDIVIITTGSQGEPMSALARMASGTHKQIKIQPGTRWCSPPSSSPATSGRSARSSTTSIAAVRTSSTKRYPTSTSPATPSATSSKR